MTSLIHNLYDAAQQSKRFPYAPVFGLVRQEQGKREKNAEDLIQKMELFGSEAKGLYMLNSELAAECTRRPAWCCKQAL